MIAPSPRVLRYRLVRCLRREFGGPRIFRLIPFFSFIHFLSANGLKIQKKRELQLDTNSSTKRRKNAHKQPSETSVELCDVWEIIRMHCCLLFSSCAAWVRSPVCAYACGYRLSHCVRVEHIRNIAWKWRKARKVRQNVSMYFTSLRQPNGNEFDNKSSRNRICVCWYQK